jgi:transposase-like protein
MSEERASESLADPGRAPAVRVLWTADVGHSGNHFPRYAYAPDDVVPRDVVGDQPTDRRQRHRSATGAGIGQLRNGVDLAAQAAPRDGATRPRSADGRVEVDQTLAGGVEEGHRRTEKKALIAVAVEQIGTGMGRVRMRQIPDGSADALQRFVEDAVTPGSLLHTDGCLGYDRLEKQGYRHRITFAKGAEADPLPRVQRVVSLLKRWLQGTHQGTVTRAHLDYYLDEFTFRFNRRRSKHRGKLFYRLVQQAVAVDPAPYRSIVKNVRRRPLRRRRTTTNSGHRP